MWILVPMRLIRPRRLTTLTAGVLLLAVACRGPQSPAAPEPPPPPPPTPSTPVITSVGVSMADASPLLPGRSRQLTAVATDSQGTTRPLTEGLVWRSSNTVVATVSESGVLQAQSPGAVLVEAVATGGASGALGVEVGAPAAPIARLAVNANNALRCAVAGATPVTFDASASEGYRLSYRWDFGDDRSETTTDARITRTLGRIQTRPATLTVTDAFGRSSSSADVPYCSFDMRTDPHTYPRFYGSHYFTFLPDSTRRVLFVNYQGWNEISGVYVADRDYPFSGVIDADLGLDLRLDNGVRLVGRVLRTAHTPALPSLELVVRGGPDEGRLLQMYYRPQY